MTTEVSTSSGKKPKEETNVVETLQSLVFAFAIAMAVRSFVTEGFFIPTGSMAPTLMGQHVRPRSPATGFEYAADAGPSFEMMRQLGQNYRDLAAPVIDPMLSMTDPIAQTTTNEIARNARMGDRVLVLKYLYAFSEPQRWDVVVFKNPTDPTGDAANFIKRLVGLPEEQLLLLDGDVFTAPLGADRSEFRIARKPEHVQRTVWIPVHDSDFVPVDTGALAKVWGRPWPGLPWESSEFDFGPKENARVWTHGSAAPATISWRWDRRPITDFTSYNVWRQIPITQRFAMSDIRVSMAVVAEDPAALAIEETIVTRKRALRFMLDGSKATLRVEDASEGAPAEGARVFAETSVPFEAPEAGAPYDIEFWHVDQELSLWVNGERIAALDYEFESLEDRLTASFNGRTVEDYRRNAPIQQPTPPVLSVRFAGSPVELHRVRVDRDLYYRPANLRDDDFNQPAENGEPITGAAFATDFDAPAQLRADQFMMLGDNSAASRDSRLWGRPSPLVTKVFGEGDPFVVPRQLLLGKAWCVYFPAPISPMPGWPAVLPDFGKLRFIR